MFRDSCFVARPRPTTLGKLTLQTLSRVARRMLEVPKARTSVNLLGFLGLHPITGDPLPWAALSPATQPDVSTQGGQTKKSEDEAGEDGAEDGDRGQLSRGYRS